MISGNTRFGRNTAAERQQQAIIATAAQKIATNRKRLSSFRANSE